MTFEFKTAVLPNGQIAVPPDIASQIPAGKELHVVLNWEVPTEIKSHNHTTGNKLRKAASASGEDSVYDSFA